jgi:crotonobetaine/carnitine-CoA ligase
MADRARRFAGGLAELGVSRGDVVAIYMENSADLVTAMFALGHLGAAGAPVNTEYRGELLAYVLNDTTARIALLDASLMPAFAAASRGYDKLTQVVVRGTTSAAHMELDMTDFARLDCAESLSTLTPTDQSDLFMVNYTSGTTGPSKGVLFPNGHVLSFAEDWLRCMHFSNDDVLYTPMPLFHTLGMILGMFSVLLSGGTVHLDGRFSASQYWSRAKACGATVGHAVFPMIPFLLSREPGPADRDHHMTRIWTGPSGYTEEFKNRFGVDVYEVYGLSEAGVVSYARDFGQVPPGSCGQLNSDRFEIMLVDTADNPVPPHVVGEAIVRSRQPFTSMLGYLNKPDKTAETFRNLWLHSGDRLYADDNGWLFFVDRAKDMIRRRSENISAYDVELVLGKYIAFSEVAVIAVPSEFEDDEIKVCAVLREGQALSVGDLSEFCRTNLPRHMQPKYLEILADLPKTPNQKLAKYKLKEHGILGQTGGTIDLATGQIADAITPRT